jgi:hypothetical protein
MEDAWPVIDDSSKAHSLSEALIQRCGLHVGGKKFWELRERQNAFDVQKSLEP